MIELTIDGKAIAVAPGTTLLEAASRLGIAVPTLCHSERLGRPGVCRLCVVDTGGRVLTAACVRPCEPGMQVQTRTEAIERYRRVLLELLASRHPSPCEKERTTGDCELEALARQYGIVTGDAAHTEDGRDDSSPVISVDHRACILCDRCILACDEIQHNDVIGRTGKGAATRIAFDLDAPMGASTCVSCGECVAACPTGALTNKVITLPLLPRTEAESVASLCPYCGVGCTVMYHVHKDRIVFAEGRDSPGSQGRLCVKGRYGWDYAFHPERLTTPLIRKPEYYPKGPLTPEVKGEAGKRTANFAEAMAAFRPATWDEALDLVASRLKAIKAEHGPGALAGFGSAKCSNEEAYLFQKLVRAVFGTNNVDHCTRLCHASSVAALLEGIGSGAVTAPFGDALKADVVLLTGTNTTENHPVAATFFKQAAAQGTKLIVVDPRRPDIADYARWYCPIRPGTDVAFYNGVMHVLVAEGWIDRKFIAERTTGFDAFASNLDDYAPERVAGICGVPAAVIREVAAAIGAARRMMIFWGMGISQHTHGTDNARCLIALCLLTGNVGRPGTGLHPLRGQNNVQGASDAGLIPMVYPDYQSVADPAAREKFEEAWGVALDPQPGLTVVEIMNGALDGTIRGMYILGENPFLSDPNANKVRKALASLDFLAVQDIFLTETAEFADVILPAASFFEKTGTYTNTDRRVQIGRQVVSPPGQARQDWEVICEISSRMGYRMSYSSPEAVFAEFASLTTSYRGLDYPTLGNEGKLWPIPVAGAPETPVLFSERFPTADGKARFVPCQFAPAKELPDEEYPFVLNTGRQLQHWHTGTMTRRAHVLDTLVPGPHVEVHPQDASQLGLSDGDRVRVESRRGAIELQLRCDDRVPRGSVFIPFHFREAAANLLTIDALDPYGKIPEFKFCAVRLMRVSSPVGSPP